MEPILVIMAAGMGSRYGGPKQKLIRLRLRVTLSWIFPLADAYQAGFRSRFYNQEGF